MIEGSLNDDQNNKSDSDDDKELKTEVNWIEDKKRIKEFFVNLKQQSG